MKEIYVGFRNKKSKSTLIAAIALSTIIVAGTCQIASAAVVDNTSATTNVSVTPNTFNNFVIAGQNYSVPKESKTVIGQTIENNKIKVTLNDCCVDTGMIMFTTHLDSTEREDYAQGMKPQISINSKLIDIHDNHYKEKYIHNDDGTCYILSYFYLKDGNIDVSQDLNIKIDYNEISVTSKSDIDSNVSGNWIFDFTINASQINKPILNKEINQTLKIDGHELYVKNIKVFPSRIELTAGSDIDSYYDTADHVCWILKDDKENKYRSSDGHGSDKSALNNYFVDTNEIKSITIIPGTSFNNATAWTSNDNEAVTINIR